MKRPWRRIPWIKLAVVVALVWFASTRVDLGDRLVVGEAPSMPESTPDEVGVILSSGATVALARGESLPVQVVERDGELREVWALLPSGREQVDLGQVGPNGLLEVRPGLRRSLRGMSLGGLALALLAWAPLPVLLAWRWHLLLRAAGVSIGAATSLRLTWVGLFFNTVMPGGAGGDLVKLVEVGRYTEHRSTVLSTIAVDRVVGLLVLIALGVIAALMVGGATSGLVTTAVLVAGAIALGFTVYTSARVRRWFDVRAFLSRLPLRDELVRLDDAVVAMRAAPLTLLAAAGVGLVVQAVAIGVTYLLARALGLDAVTPVDMALVVPIANVANAVPLSPGGLGQLEVAFQELMHRQGLSSLAQGFMVGVLVRVVTVVWSLPGLFLWMTKMRGAQLPREVGDGARDPETEALTATTSRLSE